MSIEVKYSEYKDEPIDSILKYRNYKAIIDEDNYIEYNKLTKSFTFVGTKVSDYIPVGLEVERLIIKDRKDAPLFISTIKHLTLVNTIVIDKYKDIESLTMRIMSDVDFQFISTYKNLKYLKLVGIKNYSNLKSDTVTNLTINHTVFDEEQLSKFTKLNNLIISNSSCTDNHLSSLKDLNSIKLICTPNIVGTSLYEMKNLLALEINECERFDSIMLKGLVSLEILVLKNVKVIDLAFISMRYLHSLVLIGCYGFEYASLQHLTQLRSLIINQVGLEGKDIRYMYMLERLHIQHQNFKDFIFLRNFRYLKELEVNTTVYLNDLDIESIKHVPSIKFNGYVPLTPTKRKLLNN